MKRWDRLSRGFRQLRWGVSVFTGTLSMAAGIFTAGTVQRFRLWKISKLVWIPPAVWTARRVPGRLPGNPPSGAQPPAPPYINTQLHRAGEIFSGAGVFYI